jgi:hypothetical protein
MHTSFNCLAVLTWIAYEFVKRLAPKPFLSFFFLRVDFTILERIRSKIYYSYAKRVRVSNYGLWIALDKEWW